MESQETATEELNGGCCVSTCCASSSSYPMDVWQFEYFDAESGETLSKFSLNAKLIHRPDAISRVINRVLEDLRKNHKELPVGWFAVTKDILHKVA